MLNIRSRHRRVHDSLNHLNCSITITQWFSLFTTSYRWWIGIENSCNKFKVTKFSVGEPFFGFQNKIADFLIVLIEIWNSVKPFFDGLINIFLFILRIWITKTFIYFVLCLELEVEALLGLFSPFIPFFSSTPFLFRYSGECNLFTYSRLPFLTFTWKENGFPIIFVYKRERKFPWKSLFFASQRLLLPHFLFPFIKSENRNLPSILCYFFFITIQYFIIWRIFLIFSSSSSFRIETSSSFPFLIHINNCSMQLREKSSLKTY